MTGPRIRLLLLLPALGALAAGCGFVRFGVADRRAALEKKWGIEIVAVRHSAGGYMLDFRYRVVDPDRARLLLDRKSKAYLVDKASGAKMLVPNPPKVGPLRQTSRQPIAGRTYFILFSNLGQTVKPGSRVSVVIGDFRADDLVVE